MTTAAAASPIVSGTTPLPHLLRRARRPRPTNALASSQIAGNFQSFLTLLTTQLQNQNPLDPLDTNQFTQQLVEFAGVQQQLNTNDSLATLVSLQQTAQSTQALGFVGQTVVVNGSTAALTNCVGDLAAERADRLHRQRQRSPTAPGRPSSPATYAVAAGNNQPFTWNGQGNDGTQ